MNVGQLIGTYKLEAPIARGGMGEVWRAKHPTLDRSVAVKLIRAEVQDRPMVRDAFLREVRNLSQLHAAQTLQVLDFGFSEEDEPFMVTEFLEGEDVERRIKAQGPLPVEQALFIAAEVLKSLSEAHARGIIHRDLKPANVFLQRLHAGGGERFGVKVLDFGIAKVLQAEDPDMTLWPGMALKGSPRYMSPEQIQSSHITPAADIYALGGLLYTMLAGAAPFSGDRAELLEAHIHEPPPSLRAARPEIIPQVEALVNACLIKEPGRRPDSADTLLKEVEGLIHLLRQAEAVDLDEDGEGDEEELATMQHEPGWDELFSAPHDSGDSGLPGLDAFSFPDPQRDSGARLSLSSNDLFGAPSGEIFPKASRVGELGELPPKSSSGAGETGGAFGSMSGLLSDEERARMRARGDIPKVDPNALFLAPKDAPAPALATSQELPGFPISSSQSPEVSAMVAELKADAGIASGRKPAPALATAQEVPRFPYSVDASGIGEMVEDLKADAGVSSAPAPASSFDLSHLGFPSGGAASTPPKEASAKPEAALPEVSLLLAQPEEPWPSRSPGGFASVASLELDREMSVDEMSEAVEDLHQDSSLLRLEFEGRPPKPDLGKKQREAEARLGLPKSSAEVAQGLDDFNHAGGAKPAYVRTLERRSSRSSGNEIWIILAGICLLTLLWIVRVPIAEGLGVSHKSEIGRLLGINKPPDTTPSKESAAALEERLLTRRGPSLLDEPEPQVDYIIKGQDVRVIVSPPARFTRVESGEVICEETDLCVVPIDVDVKVELKGYKTVLLTGDDLYDRRGRRWNLRLYPGR